MFVADDSENWNGLGIPLLIFTFTIYPHLKIWSKFVTLTLSTSALHVTLINFELLIVVLTTALFYWKLVQSILLTTY